MLTWAVFMAIVFACFRFGGGFGIYSQKSFLPLKLDLFAIGILSQLSLDWFTSVSGCTRTFIPFLMPTAGALFLIFIPVSRNVGLAIWLVVFCGLMAELTGGGSRVDRTVMLVLDSQVLRWYGTISYSLYLVHEPVISVSKHLILSAYPNCPEFYLCMALAVATLPAVTAFSWLMYTYVEQPAIRLGKKIRRSVDRTMIRLVAVDHS